MDEAEINKIKHTASVVLHQFGGRKNAAQDCKDPARPGRDLFKEKTSAFDGKGLPGAKAQKRKAFREQRSAYYNKKGFYGAKAELRKAFRKEGYRHIWFELTPRWLSISVCKPSGKVTTIRV